jgi:hypothetical protein
MHLFGGEQEAAENLFAVFNVTTTWKATQVTT